MIKPCTTNRRDEGTKMLFLLLEIRTSAQNPLNHTHQSCKSSPWVRQKKSDRARLWNCLHDLVIACTAVIVSGEESMEAADPRMALYLTGEQGEGNYSCEKKKLRLVSQWYLEKVLWQLIHLHRCDNYFLLPQLTCSACLCGRLFLLLPREKYFWCLPCACWAFSHEIRLKQQDL